MKVQVYAVKYHVEITGQGNALVLLHGFTGSGANWSSQVEILSRHYRVVTIDLLGHGQTEIPYAHERYHIKYAARDLIDLFRRLDLGKVHLLGYSMGGRLALYTAIYYPESLQTLILESASPGIENLDERRARVEQDEALAKKILRDGLENFVAYWESLTLWETQSAEQRTQLHAQRLQNNPLGLRNSLLGMGTGVQPSLWNNLQMLMMPTLLITGECDTKFADIARQMHERLPHSLLSIIPSAGHATHLERPIQFRRAVIDFLK